MSFVNMFRPENVAAHLKSMPDLVTPVMDSVFKDRVQIPLAYVGKDEVEAVLKEIPFVARGAESYPLESKPRQAEFFEPLPLRIQALLSAVELNNLKQMTSEGREVYVRNKVDQLRRIIRRTTEAVCASALNGSLRWPLYIDGHPDNWEYYVAEYGSVLEHTPETLWDAEGVGATDIFKCLRAMKSLIQANGYGATLEIWAGDTAFEALMSFVDASPERSKVPMEFGEQGINIAGFQVKSRSETYTDPKTETSVPAVPANTVRMIATDAGHRLAYCAIDDLAAQLQPKPFFVKPIELKDPSGIRLVGESKPFPIVNVKGICDAVVVGA